MTDYTDLKRRLEAEIVAILGPSGADYSVEPVTFYMECKAAIAALEAEVARMRSAKRVSFAFDGKGWILRADLSDMPIALKAGDIWNLALADQPAEGGK